MQKFLHFLVVLFLHSEGNELKAAAETEARPCEICAVMCLQVKLHYCIQSVMCRVWWLYLQSASHTLLSDWMCQKHRILSSETNTLSSLRLLWLSGSRFSTCFAFSKVSCHMKKNLKELLVSGSAVGHRSIWDWSEELSSSLSRMMQPKLRETVVV